MRINHFLVLLTGVILLGSCREDMDSNFRTAYLQEHIQNCQYMTTYTFHNLWGYRHKYRDSTYQKLIDPAWEACGEFYSFLSDDFYNAEQPDMGISYKQWQQADSLQAKAFQKITDMAPPFFRKKMPFVKLETIRPENSPELKIAKYHSNCFRLANTLLRILQWAEQPFTTSVQRKLDFMNLQATSDTIQAGHPLKAMSTVALFDDYKNYTIIRSMQDVRLLRLDSPTGHFLLQITGPAPKCSLTYFDTHYLREINHEIVF